MTQAPSSTRWWITPGWAAYLACSWTWCIGMYLPVLLLRDFGWWSFAVFALPNCLGAAAMGLVLRRPGASEALVGAHARACSLFSYATMAFQLFFLLLLTGRLGPGTIVLLGAIPAAVTVSMLAIRRRTRLLGAGLALAASLACAAWFVSEGPVSPADLPTPAAGPSHLLALAPVCTFGFLLCPYLDLTFHRARREAQGAAGSAAFIIGFLLLFPLMIGFTVLYGVRAIAVDAVAPWRAIAIPAVFHIGVQLWLTLTLHGNSEDLAIAPGKPRVSPARLAIAVALIAGVFLWKFLQSMRWLPAMYHGLAFDEVVYRSFMALYGLVFPAYVYLCIFSTRGIQPAPRPRDLAVLLASVALAGPCYWLGFIERRTWWLLPGVAIVLLAKAFTSRAAPAAPAPTGPST